MSHMLSIGAVNKAKFTTLDLEPFDWFSPLTETLQYLYLQRQYLTHSTKWRYTTGKETQLSKAKQV